MKRTSSRNYHVLAVVVMFAALTASCRRPASVEVDPALAYMVTSDTIALIGVDLEQLRATPVYRGWIASHIENLAKGGGVDFDRDVVELLGVSNGKEVLVYARGRRGILRLNSNLALPLAKGGIPPALQAKIRSIPAGNQVWAAGIGPDPRLAAAIPDAGSLSNVRKIVSSIRSWTAGMDLRSGLKIEINGAYSSNADAKTVLDALRGLLGLGRLSTPADAPELLRFYDGIKVSQQNAAVRISANVPAADLNAFLQRWQAPQN